MKEEFEKKMTTACKVNAVYILLYIIFIVLIFYILMQLFQEVEESHLKQMKDFLNLYTELIETNHEEIGKVSDKF